MGGTSVCHAHGEFWPNVPRTVQSAEPLPGNSPMITRRAFLFATAVTFVSCSLFNSTALAQEAAPKQKPDRLNGPPLVTAKGWAIVDGENGKFLWGEHENDPLVMAS